MCVPYKCENVIRDVPRIFSFTPVGMMSHYSAHGFRLSSKQVKKVCQKCPIRVRFQLCFLVRSWKALGAKFIQRKSSLFEQSCPFLGQGYLVQGQMQLSFGSQPGARRCFQNVSNCAPMRYLRRFWRSEPLLIFFFLFLGALIPVSVRWLIQSL